MEPDPKPISTTSPASPSQTRSTLLERRLHVAADVDDPRQDVIAVDAHGDQPLRPVPDEQTAQPLTASHGMLPLSHAIVTAPAASVSVTLTRTLPLARVRATRPAMS